MLLSTIKFFLDSILDFIFIYECEICHRHLEDKRMIICSECIHKIERVEPVDIERTFTTKFRSDGYISKAFACFYFKDESIIQTLIHELKYQNKPSIGILLGEIVGNSVKNDPDFISSDALIPVPLHKIRLRERGYNQSELISKGINRVTGINLINDLLIRVRNTQTQTKLNLEQRKENVKDAFKVKDKYKNFVPWRKFIVVDDVITTGSTVNQCAKALVDAGASRVLALSIAIAN
ncbi:ComF family protein [Candidatus Kryptobacter tengchongensis]|uniref:ComF family protein n=1 Tax=Kryptobacter tengchongensis TaxID=1643429 RepID=A0A656D3B4_KRYT1|nr:ComF family protein [Candidatus Kryptobacter tengchongensis]CUS96850.1 comF family protein [Candidatus Kryptobacter tengchongensis]